MIRDFPGNQQDKVIVAGLAILVLILGYWRMVPQVCGAFHDDAICLLLLLTGSSIWASGGGRGNIG